MEATMTHREREALEEQPAFYFLFFGSLSLVYLYGININEDKFILRYI